MIKRFEFDAAHKLEAHDGKCAHLHGHRWIVELTLEAEELVTGGASDGMIVDFGKLKAYVQDVIGWLDHEYLNERLGMRQPTSEVLARWLYHQIAEMPRLPACTGKLVKIAVEESPGSRVEYEP